ncbi:MAG: TldD/PmbA family protein, partial [Candidatus Aminicenantes bacterium]|nr:TldD/PmbA family protein [Candidatus Aminicenantes bacterium]
EVATSAAGLLSPEAIAKKAVERVTRLIGARKVESQNVPVVFEAPVTGSLLLGFLAQCISGPALDRRQTFLLDKLGQKIGSDLITIYDNALLPGGRGTAPFDTEGVPARKTLVMESGVLKSYLLNTYYGRKLKMASTGNAGGTTNFHLAAGTSKPADIIKSVDKGLLLTGTIGFGLVPTTGDISTGAFGLWIEKGEIAYPVAEITISGNLADVLKGIEMVGDDLDPGDSVSGPTVKTAVMSIGGKAAT